MNSSGLLAKEATFTGSVPTLFACGYYDAEQVRKIARVLFQGLATACVENTMGDLFRTPASVVAEVKKEMIEYLRQKSEAYAAEYAMTIGCSAFIERPVHVVEDLLEGYVHSKRNLFTKMSGWILSEKKEDRIDDFSQEMDEMGAWMIGHRENLAKALLKSIDFHNIHHCEMKFESAKDLAAHRNKCSLRPVNCNNEGCTEVFCALYARKHDASCPLKPLPCEQKCSAIVVRAEMDKHCITVCPMKLVNCPFYQVGCLSTLPQGTIQEHCAEFLGSHLLCVLQALHKQDVPGGDLTQRAVLLEKSLSPSQRSKALDIGSLSLTIKEQEAKIKTLEQDLGKVQQDLKTTDASAEALQLCKEMQNLQKRVDGQSPKEGG